MINTKSSGYLFLAILVLTVSYFFFAKSQVTISIDSINLDEGTFLIRSFVDNERESTPVINSLKSGSSFVLELPLDSIFDFEPIILHIGHPLYKMQKIVITKNPFIFRWQEIKIIPDCLCLKNAYEKGGVSLKEISDHIEYIIDTHIPYVGLEIVAKETYKHQRELALLPASARWKLGVTSGWEKRKIDILRSEMKKNYNRLMIRLSTAYGQLRH